MISPPPIPGRPLERLRFVIPARDEEGCVASTIERLHVELRLGQVPHEIIVVDDGRRDTTWAKLNAMKGDAVVIMMPDESDDCHDVVRYWQVLQEGYDCVFGSHFIKEVAIFSSVFTSGWKKYSSRGDYRKTE